MLFEAKGFHVYEAGDGVDGCLLAASVCPAVILMDVSMPVMDGVTAANQLRQHPATRSIPIVAYTGEAGALATRERGAFAAILSKSIPFNSVLKTVETVL